MVPRKADQPELTRLQIVATAVALIDEVGLAALSVRRLGAALGVDPSTIYYYVPSKAALFDLVVEEVLAGVDTSSAEAPGGFEVRLVAAERAYREALLRHPHVMPLVAVRSLRTPGQLRMIEAFSQIFLDAGFSPVESLIALDVTGMTVLGLTNMYAASITRPEYARQTPIWDSVIEGALPPGDFPNLVEVLVPAGVVDADLEFDRAMRAMAAGLQALHAQGLLAPSLQDERNAARRRRDRAAGGPAETSHRPRPGAEGAPI